jgi:hypothetical protein
MKVYFPTMTPEKRYVHLKVPPETAALLKSKEHAAS